MYYFVGSFYLATVLTTVKMSTTSSTLAKFERNHQLDNLLCSDAEKVFSNDAESKSECAISCKENQSCYTIFFSQSSGKCYGCNTVYNSVSVQNLPPGDGNVHYQIYPLCSEGWFGYMRSCYKLSTHVWFTQGSVECASEGGHAVYIETSVENEFLKYFIRTDSTTWAWYIGITDCAEPGVWRYHGSDEPVQFTDFKVLNTGDSCCALFFDGYDYQWAQYGCEDPDHGFPTICEKTVL